MRCHLPPESWQEGEVILPPGEAHYLREVRRGTVGERVELFDGRGRLADAEIVAVRGPQVTVAWSQSWQVAAPAPAFCLLQSLPKAQKMDLIVQKAVELGVATLAPVQTEHAVVRLDEARAARKVERWQTVALNAARQCGAAWVAEVQAVQDLATAIDRCGRVLVGDLGSDARPLKEALTAARRDGVAELAVAIGPEGDFSEAERALLREGGAIPVSLGPTVLRTETAALYALSALRYEFR